MCCGEELKCYDTLKQEFEEYINWSNEIRLKENPVNLSPVDYRIKYRQTI